MAATGISYWDWGHNVRFSAPAHRPDTHTKSCSVRCGMPAAKKEDRDGTPLRYPEQRRDCRTTGLLGRGYPAPAWDRQNNLIYTVDCTEEQPFEGPVCEIGTRDGDVSAGLGVLDDGRSYLAVHVQPAAGAQPPVLYAVEATGKRLAVFGSPTTGADGRPSRRSRTPDFYDLPDGLIPPAGPGGRIRTVRFGVVSPPDPDSHVERVLCLLSYGSDGVTAESRFFASPLGGVMSPIRVLPQPADQLAIHPDRTFAWAIPGVGPNTSAVAYRYSLRDEQLEPKPYPLDSPSHIEEAAFQQDSDGKLWCAVRVAAGLQLLAAHENPETDSKIIDSSPPDQGEFDFGGCCAAGPGGTVWTAQPYFAQTEHGVVSWDLVAMEMASPARIVTTAGAISHLDVAW
jgi:hypothetical protein